MYTKRPVHQGIGMHIWRTNSTPLSFFLRRRTSRSWAWPTLVLPWVFPAHQYFVACALSTLPESTSCFPYENCTTDAAVFRPVYLLSGTKATNHTVRVFVWVVCLRIVTFITRKYLGAAAKSKPAIAFAIVRAATTTGEFLTSNNAEGFLWLLSWQCLVTRSECGWSYSEEFDFRKLKYHLAMALATWRRCTLTTDCNNTGCREGAWTFSTCWNEAARKKIGDSTAIQVKIAGAVWIRMYQLSTEA